MSSKTEKCPSFENHEHVSLPRLWRLVLALYSPMKIDPHGFCSSLNKKATKFTRHFWMKTWSWIAKNSMTHNEEITTLAQFSDSIFWEIIFAAKATPCLKIIFFFYGEADSLDKLFVHAKYIKRKITPQLRCAGITHFKKSGTIWKDVRKGRALIVKAFLSSTWFFSLSLYFCSHFSKYYRCYKWRKLDRDAINQYKRHNL